VGPTQNNYLYQVVDVREDTWFYRCECSANRNDDDEVPGSHVLWLIYETKNDQIGVAPPSWLACTRQFTPRPTR
jgi:hypothetical protein